MDTRHSFSYSPWDIYFQCLLVSDSDEKLTVNLKKTPLHNMSHFYLAAVRFSTCLWLSTIWLWYVKLWNFLSLSYLVLIKLLGYIDCFLFNLGYSPSFFNFFFCLFFLFSFWGSHYRYVGTSNGVPYICEILFIYYFF